MSAPVYPVLLSKITLPAARTFEVEGGTVVSVAAGSYYLRGDGASDDLLKVIEDAINAVASNSWTVSVQFFHDHTHESATAVGQAVQVTIASSSSAQLDFSAGTFDETLLGFPADYDETALSHAAATSPATAWVSPTPTSLQETDPHRPGLEQRESPSGQVFTFATSDVHEREALEVDAVHRSRVWSRDNDGDPSAALEAFWRLAGDGRTLDFLQAAVSSSELLAALSSASRVRLAHFDRDTCQRFGRRRRQRGRPFYDLALGLKGSLDTPTTSPALATHYPPGHSSTLEIWVDAAQAGAGNAPNDLGSQGAGLFTASGSPVFNSSGGPTGGAAWEFDGTNYYASPVITTVAAPSTVWVIGKINVDGVTRAVMGTSSSDYLMYFGSTTYSVRHRANPSLTVTALTAGEWAVLMYQVIGGAANDLVGVHSATDGSGSDSDTNVSDAATGTAFRIGANVGSNRLKGSIVEAGINSAAVSLADLVTYAQNKYAGAF